MSTVSGYCDGIKDDDLYGWAWRPDAPNDPVEIEVFADGRLVHEAVASVYRPDLRAAGVGHGRYGWRMPLGLDPDRTEPIQFLVRAKGGDPLTDGAFTLDVDTAVGDRDNPAYRDLLDAMLGTGPAFVRPVEPPVVPTTLLAYCPVALDGQAMGANEYSYAFVMRAFLPVLERLGRVRRVADAAEADAIAVDCIARGEAAILFSFAPPHRTMLGVRCPVIPVIAWEFPTIPSSDWGGDEKRHDWRFVLRQCGRAITLSRFAADGIRATLGADFPVAAVPSPVWDRFPELHDCPPPPAAATIEIDGFAFDTRTRTFGATLPTPALPAPGELPAEVTLDGIVFTSVFSPRDGRKNWQDIVSAFAARFIDEPGATLVLKMVEPNVGVWWWELHDTLNRLRPFACRILALQGFLDDAQYNALVRATHWVVNASHAEGQCLPLLEYMSAGRPAVSPAHTAMADYIDPSNSIAVASDEENCGFPHDPSNELSTTRHRVHWSSLADAYGEAFRIARDDPDAYRRLADGARATMRAFCADDVVAATLDGWLGLGTGRATLADSPSPVRRMLAR